MLGKAEGVARHRRMLRFGWGCVCTRAVPAQPPTPSLFLFSSLCMYSSLRMDFNGWPNGARVNLPPTRAPWMDVMWTENIFYKNCIPVLKLTNHCGDLSIDRSHQSYLPSFSHQVPNLRFGGGRDGLLGVLLRWNFLFFSPDDSLLTPSWCPPLVRNIPCSHCFGLYT